MEIEDILLLNLIEEIENEENMRQRYIADDPFDLSDLNFIKLFRLRKQDVENLEGLLEPFMPQRQRTSAISTRTKLLVALRMFASGSYQLDIGKNHTACISQPSVSRSMHNIIDAFNEPAILNQFVHFPNTIGELRNVRQRFFNEYRVPGIVGCIDGTQVAIVTPVENEHLYLNRKGYHSLNVQIICDEKLRIMHVNSRFPGSTHDSYVWQHSNIEAFLRNLPLEVRGTFYLLGDSGYPLRPWLMTPILPEPQPNTPQHAYNVGVRRIRLLIEICHGRLKNRFRCLLRDRTLHYHPQVAGKIINACCVLHNICIENNIPIYNDDDLPEENENHNEVEVLNVQNHVQNQNDLAEGRRIRQLLVQNYFN